jgi:hypothetical protein
MDHDEQHDYLGRESGDEPERIPPFERNVFAPEITVSNAINGVIVARALEFFAVDYLEAATRAAAQPGLSATAVNMHLMNAVNMTDRISALISALNPEKMYLELSYYGSPNTEEI